MGCHVEVWRKVQIETEMQKALREKWDLAGITFPRNIKTIAKLILALKKASIITSILCCCPQICWKISYNNRGEVLT